MTDKIDVAALRDLLLRLRLQAEVGALNTPDEHKHVGYGGAADAIVVLLEAVEAKDGLAAENARLRDVLTRIANGNNTAAGLAALAALSGSP